MVQDARDILDPVKQTRSRRKLGGRFVEIRSTGVSSPGEGRPAELSSKFFIYRAAVSEDRK